MTIEEGKQLYITANNVSFSLIDRPKFTVSILDMYTLQIHS